jgi:hypothetical protein
MCIVIDTNSFSSVFITTSKDHNEFESVYNWILHQNGKIVYGGNTYRKELEKSKKFIPIFRRLKDKRKAVELPDCQKVDEIERELYLKVKDTKFNDPHIIAIVTVSKCKIVCTKDKESEEFLLNKELYPRGIKPPKIYKKKSNKNLLTNNNIVEICKPSLKLNKDEIAALLL